MQRKTQKRQESVSCAVNGVGLPLFGGIDSETSITVATGDFKKAFVPSRCLADWRQVGAVTEDGITRACLSNPQVLKEIGDNVDTDRLYYAIQKANDLAVHSLNIAGYEAERLEARVNKKEVEETICGQTQRTDWSDFLMRVGMVLLMISSFPSR